MRQYKIKTQGADTCETEWPRWVPWIDSDGNTRYYMLCPSEDAENERHDPWPECNGESWCTATSRGCVLCGGYGFHVRWYPEAGIGFSGSSCRACNCEWWDERARTIENFENDE